MCPRRLGVNHVPKYLSVCYGQVHSILFLGMKINLCEGEKCHMSEY